MKNDAAQKVANIFIYFIFIFIYFNKNNTSKIKEKYKAYGGVGWKANKACNLPTPKIYNITNININ